MKRVVVFALLGPLLGGLVACVIVAPIVVYLEGHPYTVNFDALLSGIVIFPASFLFGIVPALVTCGADFLMRNVRHRWFVVGLIGAAAGFPAFHDNFLMTASHFWWPLVGGLIGGIPAVVCSWLASGVTRQRSGVESGAG